MKKIFALCVALTVLIVSLTGCNRTLSNGNAKDLEWPDKIFVKGTSKKDSDRNGLSDNTVTQQDTSITDESSQNDDSYRIKSDEKSESSNNDVNTTVSEQKSDKIPVEIVNVENVVRKEALDLRLTKEIMERGIINQGNMNRISNVIKKAVRGEDVTIGIIGGSITAGSGASSTSRRYADRFISWWRGTFPDSTLNYINAGIGATDSLMGVHRVEKDVLYKNPDLVVVDFTVNDVADYSALYKESYESLIRKIMNWKSSPAVLTVAMFNQNGINLQEVHSEVVKYYDIPMVSYKNAIWPDGGSKVYQWSEIGSDNVHPNDTGHAVISELLIYYINTVREKLTLIPETVEPIKAKPLTEAGFENGTLFTNQTITAKSLGSFSVNNYAFSQFKQGWTVSGGNEPIVFNINNAKNIYILYKMDKSSGKAGRVSVTLDGKEIGVIDSDFSGGWGDYAWFYQVLDGNIVGNHTVEIRLISNGDNKNFALLGLMIS